MTVVVTGASSQIGHFLIQRLIERDRPVLAISRHPRMGGSARMRWLQATLPDLPALDAIAPATPSALVSFGPLDALAAWLSRQSVAPVARIVATSSMSVLSKLDSQDAAEREVVRRLQAGEEGLARECARLGIGWTLLRPTLVYGAGLDKSLSPIARRARRWRLFPLPLANGLRQPVHADDIAQAVLAALDNPRSAGRILQIGGGERLRYADMFRRVRGSLGAWTLPVPIPAFALALLARLLPAARGPVSRLERDLVADNAELVELLGVRPRGFRPTPASWEAPGA